MSANTGTRPKVLLINPNTSEQTTAMMARLAQAALPAGLELVCATATRGAAMITNEADLRVSEGEVLALGRAQAASVSAIVISAFGNPGLAALSAELSVPVVGIGEAAMREAGKGGRRFAVATTTPGLEQSIAASVASLGLAAGFTGTRIPPGDPLALAAQPELQVQRLADAVRTCIDVDGAQAVVIGGGPLAESAERLARQFAVPVISPVAAAMREVARLLQSVTPVAADAGC